MDLKSFVSEALSQIIEGIDVARTSSGGEGIASGRYVKQLNTTAGIMQDADGSLYTAVEFDVAVTTLGGIEAGGGIKIAVVSLGTKATSENQTVSRVRFTVPMRFNEHRDEDFQ